MKTKPTSVNTFGTFLETLKKETAGGGQAAQDLSIKILVSLDERPHPLRVRELISELEMPVTSAVCALNSLESLNLVKLGIVGADDVAEITPLGKQAARLSR